MSKPIIVSTAGKAIEEKALRKFEASMLGEVVHPSEERYERARLLWNGVIDPRHPRYRPVSAPRDRADTQSVSR
jgi:hypothetical protein